MMRWICASAVVLGLVVAGAWAHCGHCGGDKHEKSAKTAKTVADKGGDAKSCAASCSKTTKAAMTAASGECPAACADRMFSKIDANHDGKLDKSEFTTTMPKLMHAYMSGECGKAHGSMGATNVSLTSMSGKSAGGCPSSCTKSGAATTAARGAERCPKKTATAVLSAFDLNGDGKLSAGEIERADMILAAVVTVSKAEHTKLAAGAKAGGCCAGSKTTAGAPIETLASRCYETIQKQQTKATPAAVSSDASTARTPAQGG